MTSTGRCVLSLPLFVALVSGCSTSPTPAKVSGRVTYKGEMVPAGSVTFHIPEGGIYTYSLRDGTFSGTDLPAGEMVVTVETESANPEGRPKEEYKGGKDKASGDPSDYMKKMQEMGRMPTGPTNDGPYVKIPPKYADKDTSPLKVNLTVGKNEFTFDLQDD
jgi:hypothetical protein